MFDISAIGEVLIDFKADTESCINMSGSLGGAACNVLTQAARLGKKCCFIGAVGNDVFGNYIKRRIDECGITPCVQTVDATTTLAIVSIDNNGERNFDFIRNPGADSMLKFTDNVCNTVENSKILVYGSLSFSKEPAASAIFEVLKKAKCIRAYDPNLRAAIWNDDARMKQMALKGMEYADILKIGDEEAMFLSGYSNLDDAASYFCRNYNTQAVFVTMGSKGCKYYTNDVQGYVPSFKVKAVDTTGAGDSFFGALLSGYLCKGFRKDSIEETVRFSCAAGALTASKKGTAEAMPTENDIINLINS